MKKQMTSKMIMSALLAICVGAGFPGETKLFSNCDCPDALMGPIPDWRAQDYENSRGITAVNYDAAQACLVLDCDFKGKDPEMSQGEIVLDLKYIPCLEANVPVNMTNRLIEVEIEIPAGFVGSASKPNGCQVFAKDSQYRGQYGAWVNCTSPGIFKVTLQPSNQASALSLPRSVTAAGFDAAKIRTIGVKIGINANSTQQFKGEIKVVKVDVSPTLPFYSAPQLPNGQPLPFVTGDSKVDIQTDGFYINDYKWFITGGNWRLIEYRQNFGSTAWFPKGNGASIHPGFIGAKMGCFRRAGVTLIRIGLLDDGSTMFDRYGAVTGYNDVFRNDVTTFLALAAQNDIKVEFVLVDFIIAGIEEENNGVYLRGRREVIENSQVRQQFMQNFLTPFLQEFGNHPALFGFDIINEPEWLIKKSDGGGWEDVTAGNDKAESPIDIVQLNDFISLCSTKIRQLAPGKFVTVGVSSPNTGLLNDFNPDYSAIHYYSWMGNLVANINRDFEIKPWCLEEFPGKGDIYTYFDTVMEYGGAGALVWNLTPGVDDQSYPFADEEEKLQEIRRFVDSIEVLTPTIVLDKTHLYFGADTSGAVTGAQTFLIGNSGPGTLNWGVAANADWLECMPGSGSGSGIVAVSVDPGGLGSGAYSGTITVSAANAGNSPQTVSVTLVVKSAAVTGVPFGEFATPFDGASVQGSVPVTGWVLDDLGVVSVKIYRGSGGQQVYIGDAVFVEGARPDVEQAYPGYPLNYRAGWGYMMLSNFLPDGGNGTFTIHAVAEDVEGNRVTLGSKTILCDNAHAGKPFGAIDTPAQGGAAAGDNFTNWGWVLTPQPNSIPTNGSTLNVYVDGVNLGHPTYNIYRSDLAAFFPGYANSGGAGGYFKLDTTAYTNGVHTIQWTATDNAGNTDGIGSRYFNIQNVGSSRASQGNSLEPQGLEKFPRVSRLTDIPNNDPVPLEIKSIPGPSTGKEKIHAGEDEIFRVNMRELDSIEIHLTPGTQVPGSTVGYMKVGEQLRSLPVGSTLDNRKGIFYWNPGVGFFGEYRLVFLRTNRSGDIEKKIVFVRINQKHGK